MAATTPIASGYGLPIAAPTGPMARVASEVGWITLAVAVTRAWLWITYLPPVGAVVALRRRARRAR